MSTETIIQQSAPVEEKPREITKRSELLQFKQVFHDLESALRIHHNTDHYDVRECFAPDVSKGTIEDSCEVFKAGTIDRIETGFQHRKRALVYPIFFWGAAELESEPVIVFRLISVGNGWRIYDYDFQRVDPECLVYDDQINRGVMKECDLVRQMIGE